MNALPKRESSDHNLLDVEDDLEDVVVVEVSLNNAAAPGTLLEAAKRGR